MAKRLTEKQKEEITELFTFGKTIDQLSDQFNCTKLTISRNLKRKLGEKKYQEIIIKINLANTAMDKKEKNISTRNEYNMVEKYNKKKGNEDKTENEDKVEEIFHETPFIEITPLNFQIDNAQQKDLSSIPISDINFPKNVYMIVDKKIELETKYLRDYPDWQFLSQNELNRKTIEIHLDIKIANRLCNKEQKVIKVPNTEVFKIVAPLLISRGISRIVSADKLIAL